MKLTSMSAEVFLSLYTRRNFCEDYLDLKEFLDILPTDVVDYFDAIIERSRPDLYDAVQKIGTFRKEAGEDIDVQIKNYVEKFKKEIGSDTVELHIFADKEDDLCL